MSWVGRVTRRPTFGSERVWCRLLGQKWQKSRDQPKHVTRGIEHVGKDGAKGNLEQISHSGSHWRLGRKKYSKSGVLNALLRTFGGIEISKAVTTQAPEESRLGGQTALGAIDARDEGVDPGDA